MGMSYEDAVAHIGLWVRIGDPKHMGKARHWSNGKIVSVPSRKAAEVLIHNHKHTEMVDLEYMKPWTSRNGTTRIKPLLEAEERERRRKAATAPRPPAHRSNDYVEGGRGKVWAQMEPDRPSLLGGMSSHTGSFLNLKLDLPAKPESVPAPPPAKATRKVIVTYPPKPESTQKENTDMAWHGNSTANPGNTEARYDYTGTDWTQSDAEIARRLGCSASSVSAKRATLIRNGVIDRRGNPITKEHGTMNGQQQQEEKRVHLTGKQRRQIEDAIVNDWERIMLARPSKAEYGRELSNLLHIEVSVPRIDNALEAIEKTWPEVVTRQRVIPSPSVVVLANALIALLEKLSEPVPYDLRQLVQSAEPSRA